ncbi:MAG: hypothetical protein ACLP9C_05345 [Acidimicrobiales bacterium]
MSTYTASCTDKEFGTATAMVGAGAVEGADDWTASTVGHTTTGRFTNPVEGVVVVGPADEEVVSGAVVVAPTWVVVVVARGGDAVCWLVECPIRKATTPTAMTTTIAPAHTMSRLLTEKVTFSLVRPSSGSGG